MPNHNAQAALVHSLNGLLADLFTLYLKTKNFHWHVKGPQFRDLHLLFDEQATALFGLTDIVAERIRKNGGAALTGIGAIASLSRIADEPRADLLATEMIAQLRDDNGKLITAIREVKAAAGAAGDNATEGFADDWTDQAETRVWFLASLLG
ncbi:DNA starvation/stationary phase protection protein [Novosphingobium umbonatum]|uniref:DNA starvation/stationary phase protection protein n=1 Tax=Novosphingobium umbonatum TaxID=1908524 RepID=A0A437ND66_9SPHN|nr:DNA starvation/stationary phase protection protein [Novosphingobium umbonatum]RVU07891.1 DNA starvation/stationary phase protection protein [Novosphingobium umbonatum]